MNSIKTDTQSKRSQVTSGGRSECTDRTRLVKASRKGPENGRTEKRRERKILSSILSRQKTPSSLWVFIEAITLFAPTARGKVPKWQWSLTRAERPLHWWVSTSQSAKECASTKLGGDDHRDQRRREWGHRSDVPPGSSRQHSAKHGQQMNNTVQKMESNPRSDTPFLS